jgi:hypothetical protein
VNLRSLHDALWDPVARIASTGGLLHDSECIVIVPDPSLLHVPFSSLISQKRKAIGQRASVVVSPCLEHFVMHTSYVNQINCVFDPLLENVVILPDHEQSSPVVFHPGNDTPRPHASSRPPLRKAPALHLNREHPGWTTVYGGTRKELTNKITNPKCRIGMILSDPIDGFRVLDGSVQLSEIASAHIGGSAGAGGPAFPPPDMELLVITCDRSIAPSLHDPGYAAKICCLYNCKRVLRVDLAHGQSITLQHQQLLDIYLTLLDNMLLWDLCYPFASALQAAQAEAIRRGMPPHIWGSLTLVGIP